MNKKTQMWLGVAAVAAVGYYLWNKSQTPKANAGGPKKLPTWGTNWDFSQGNQFTNPYKHTYRGADGCPSGWSREKNRNGVMVCKSPDGTKQYRTN